jgi:hypothetical protein
VSIESNWVLIRPAFPLKRNPVGLSFKRVLENYPFLTPRVEIKKANLHGVSTGAILGRFSNAAAVNVTGSTNGLRGTLGRSAFTAPRFPPSRLLDRVDANWPITSESPVNR